jgi:hypothetical protein
MRKAARPSEGAHKEGALRFASPTIGTLKLERAVGIRTYRADRGVIKPLALTIREPAVKQKLVARTGIEPVTGGLWFRCSTD